MWNLHINVRENLIDIPRESQAQTLSHYVFTEFIFVVCVYIYIYMRSIRPKASAPLASSVIFCQFILCEISEDLYISIML